MLHMKFIEPAHKSLSTMTLKAHWALPSFSAIFLIIKLRLPLFFLDLDYFFVREEYLSRLLNLVCKLFHRNMVAYVKWSTALN